MPPREELRIVDYVPSSENEGVLFVADKSTNQISFEPLSDVSLDLENKSLNHFSASSLGRRVRGYVTFDENGVPSGEADFVTPPQADEVENF